MSRDAFADLAALIHPLPDPPDDDHDVDGYQAVLDQIAQDRADTVAQLRLAWEEGENDPLLATLASARRARERAEELTRWAFAYGLEFTGRARYTLGELADAAGYRSPSGVATAYDHKDIAEVADQTGASPRPRDDGPDAPDPTKVEELLHDMQLRGPSAARGRVLEVYYLLLKDGWSPYPPQPRAPGTKASKRYVRWIRQWPAGTRVTLYQEPTGYLAASGKIKPDDPRRFYVDYTEHDTEYVAEQLAALTGRVNEADQGRAAKAS
ncbi:hypothetical protein [Micromonospora andamanensis]|uniref:hypothetical protein n=1 Tax=Micromonospora andamanensis TaxID=1287068 RepID=UPI0019508A1F|nr:hypothetical protein [Micromonospora andamanensis]